MSNPEGKLIVLDPEVSAAKGLAKLASRPATLEGARVGFLWNHRSGGDRILARVRTRLNEKYHLAATRHRTKQHLGELASEEILADLTSDCDVVVTALGD